MPSLELGEEPVVMPEVDDGANDEEDGEDRKRPAEDQQGNHEMQHCRGLVEFRGGDEETENRKGQVVGGIVCI